MGVATALPASLAKVQKQDKLTGAQKENRTQGILRGDVT